MPHDMWGPLWPHRGTLRGPRSGSTGDLGSGKSPGGDDVEKKTESSPVGDSGVSDASWRETGARRDRAPRLPPHAAAYRPPVWGAGAPIWGPRRSPGGSWRGSWEVPRRVEIGVLEGVSGRPGIFGEKANFRHF